jgi:glucokinase
MLSAAIHLGGTKIARVLGTPNGYLIAEQTIATGGDAGPDRVVARIAGFVRSHGGAPAALSIGVPGLLDRAIGETPFRPSLATQWRGVPLPARLSA